MTATCRLWMVIVLGQVSAGTPVGPPDDAQPREDRSKAIRAAVDEYELYLGNDERTKLVRSPQPVQTFEDPVTLSQHGSVYLWADQHRPLAIGSFYFQADGARVDEFQSLATGGELTAEFAGAVVWRPQTPGIKIQPLDDKDEVPATKELRLRTMRDIARRFTASVTDRRAGRLELRLLPQPLHRYQDANSGLVDGAIFSFAKGTNPEVLLLLEAHSQNGSDRWHFALARMSARGCTVNYKDREIWALSSVGFKQDADQPYFNRYTR